MGIEQELMAFIFVMSLVSIPIIALLKRKPKSEASKIEGLEARVKDLESKLLDKGSEIHEIRTELTFMQRLLEHKKN